MKLFLICLLAVGAFAAPNRRIHRRGYGTIVGGANAAQGQFPWQLSFQDTSFNPPFHFCGGSIYDSTTGITAAHCVSGEDFTNPQNLDIVGGDLALSDNSGMEQRRTVTTIIQHENYDSRTFENDIALLKTTQAFNLNTDVAAIALAPAGSDFDGTSCTVTGWGTLSSGGSSPDILQWVDVPVVSNAECDVNYNGGIYPSMICAGVVGKDSCQGDSGGPMVCQGFLGGIVSWGRGCALDGYPGVYTRVSSFVDWVIANA